ncbi:MAG: glycosyltransferase family 2 protein [Planctomycetota bacterium]|nr:MAG: glycosyltransferase family 2 protein [Planctomycetota bacterium]
MAAGLVTIAVVPGERFSEAGRSLERILAHRDPSHALTYIDGGSPPLVRQFLEQRAARHRFRLLSTERYVSANEARNLAVAGVRTKYVAFVGNDVLVSPGWLETLLECAESTGAWVVGPVCCRADAASTVCSAGAEAEILSRGGKRVFHERDEHSGRRLADVRPTLRRQPVQQVAFHAALVRRDVFTRLGPLDEGLKSGAEHTDLCLRVRDLGGRVYLEPESLVTHVAPPSFEASDLEYFQLRWSDAWNRSTVERFRKKWGLADDDPGLRALAERLDDHRRLTLEPYRRLLRILGRGPARWVERTLIAPLEQAVNRRRYPPLAGPHAFPAKAA